MSTSTEIVVKYFDKKVCIYHHWDGYFEGVGADLVKSIDG